MKKLIFLSALFLIQACSTADLYPSLNEDESIWMREWVFSGKSLKNRSVQDVGADFSNAVLFENTVIFAHTQNGVVSFYPGIQRVRWTFPLKDGVLSEITVAQSKVYFAGSDGFFYCLDAQTGKSIWKYEIRNPYVSKPSISAGRVFFNTSDDHVFALDAGTGKWLWNYRRRSSLSTSIRGASTPVVHEGKVYVGFSDGYFVSLGLEEGNLRWEKNLGRSSKFNDVDATPVIDDGVIYTGSYDGAVYALKLSSGDTIWRTDVGLSRSVLLDQDQLIVSSNEGKILNLNRKNGHIDWEFILDSGSPTQVILWKDTLTFASSYQFLYTISKTDGKPLSRFHVGRNSGFVGDPVLNQERREFYILSSAGNLYAFKYRF